jgi:hypothetical protein
MDDCAQPEDYCSSGDSHAHNRTTPNFATAERPVHFRANHQGKDRQGFQDKK